MMKFFSSFCCSVAKSCPPPCNHGLQHPALSLTVSWSLLKLMSIEPVMPSSHLIICRLFLLRPSIFLITLWNQYNHDTKPKQRCCLKKGIYIYIHHRTHTRNSQQNISKQNQTNMKDNTSWSTHHFSQGCKIKSTIKTMWLNISWESEGLPCWLSVKNPLVNAGETRVWSLSQKDPTCLSITRPVWHNCWACAPKPGSQDHRACAPGPGSRSYWSWCGAEPAVHSKRSRCSEKPEHTPREGLSCAATREKPWRPSTSKDKSVSESTGKKGKFKQALTSRTW